MQAASCRPRCEQTALHGAEVALSPAVHFPGGVQSLALTVKKNLETKLGINIAESQNNALNSRGRRKGAGRKTRLDISHHQRSVYMAVSSHSTLEISWGDPESQGGQF